MLGETLKDSKVLLKDGTKPTKRIFCHIQTLERALRWIEKKYGKVEPVILRTKGLATIYFKEAEKAPAVS